jgi:hypothetical protein
VFWDGPLLAYQFKGLLLLREDVDARHDNGEVRHQTRNVMAGLIPSIHGLLVDMP